MIVLDKLKNELIKSGAAIVKATNIDVLPLEQSLGMKSAISIAVALDKSVIKSIGKGPTLEYYEEYKAKNALLSQLSLQAVGMLEDAGYKAESFNATVKGKSKNNLTETFQHKTAATLSGVGWIGKSALLVTKEYGSAVRFTTVLTDIEYNGIKKEYKSYCGSCTKCENACPGSAIKGVSWKHGMQRDEYYDAQACRRAARLKASEIGINASICGICISVCPWTTKYIMK